MIEEIVPIAELPVIGSIIPGQKPLAVEDKAVMEKDVKIGRASCRERV